MFAYHHSLANAYSVYFRVMALLNDDDVSDPTFFIVGTYQNGREQGLTLSPDSTSVIYITEDRDTADIVIYYGYGSNQSVSEDAYKHSKSFTTIDDAANYVVKTVLTYQAKQKQIRSHYSIKAS